MKYKYLYQDRENQNREGEIAAQLSLQEGSIKKIVNATFEKIGARNRAEAVAIALRKHLLKV